MSGAVIGAEKRAKNIIWTAAQDYSFTPRYVSFRQDGEPDFYMNSIIGYAHKWYRSSELETLADSFQNSAKRDLYDGLLWFALEHCAFEREVAGRPLLAELRETYASDFLRLAYLRTKQQWMAEDSTVYALQEARCREILGRKPAHLSAREKSLYDRLTFSGDLSAPELVGRVTDVFREYYHYSEHGDHISRAYRMWRQAVGRFSRRLPVRMIRAETLRIGAGGNLSEQSGAGPLKSKHIKTQANFERDHAYLEACFGQPLYSFGKERELNDLYCVGAHEPCRLFYTAGTGERAENTDTSARAARRDAQKQREANERHFRENRRIYDAAVTRLSEQVRNVMLVCPQPLPVRTRAGKLSAQDVWRGIYLDDDRVFRETNSEEVPEFSVDLLLDGSASCLEYQERIAAQGIVVARSLQNCKIPVQVSAFCSLRGYTVLRRFITYGETDRNQSIFDYYAAGWNRDGLALRGITQLMGESGCRNRILIVFTDANPNDDRRLAPEEGNVSFSKDYSDAAGRMDTAREVRRLRKSGVRVMAVLNGKYGNPEGAKEIYGSEVVRIEDPRHLAEAAGRLLQKEICNLTGVQ